MSENSFDYRNFDLSYVDYDSLYEKIPNKYQLTQTIIKLGHRIIESRSSQMNIKTAIQMAVDEILKGNFEFVEGEADFINDDFEDELELKPIKSKPIKIAVNEDIIDDGDDDIYDDDDDDDYSGYDDDDFDDDDDDDDDDHGDDDDDDDE